MFVYVFLVKFEDREYGSTFSYSLHTTILQILDILTIVETFAKIANVEYSQCAAATVKLSCLCRSTSSKRLHLTVPAIRYFYDFSELFLIELFDNLFLKFVKVSQILLPMSGILVTFALFFKRNCQKFGDLNLLNSLRL